MTAQDLRDWRNSHKTAEGKPVSQRVLAKLLHVTTKRVQAWEQGTVKGIHDWVPNALELIDRLNYGAERLAEFPETDGKPDAD